jgi:ankyrin repeat protein
MVRCLVTDLGADVNLANRENLPPLYIAVQAGNLSMVSCLFNELGADINQTALDRPTLLSVAHDDWQNAGPTSILQGTVEALHYTRQPWRNILTFFAFLLENSALTSTKRHQMGSPLLLQPRLRSMPTSSQGWSRQVRTPRYVYCILKMPQRPISQ